MALVARVVEPAIRLYLGNHYQLMQGAHAIGALPARWGSQFQSRSDPILFAGHTRAMVQAGNIQQCATQPIRLFAYARCPLPGRRQCVLLPSSVVHFHEDRQRSCRMTDQESDGAMARSRYQVPWGFHLYFSRRYTLTGKLYKSVRMVRQLQALVIILQQGNLKHSVEA